MALALYSEPHLLWTFAGTEIRSKLGKPEEAPLNVCFDPELLETALGIPKWEVDDIRNHLDLRVCEWMKQKQTVESMWTTFKDTPEEHSRLFKMLFPGVSITNQPATIERHSAIIYALIDNHPLPPLAALFLPWVVPSSGPYLRPMGAFNVEEVDPHLLSILGRSAGIPPEEVSAQLHNAVTIIPAEQRQRFLDHDRWRTSGMSALTQLSTSYKDSFNDSIPKTLLDQWKWVETSDHQWVASQPEAVLDQLAAALVEPGLHQLYAEMLARANHPSDLSQWDEETIRSFATPDHIRPLIEPLMSWVEDPESAKHLAHTRQLPEETVKRVLANVAEAWRTHAETHWLSIADDTPSVAQRMAGHLISLLSSLYYFQKKTPDPRRDHRLILPLFIAHYMTQSGRNNPILSAVTSPAPFDFSQHADVISQWFWPTWLRILNASEEHDNVTDEVLFDMKFED